MNRRAVLLDRLAVALCLGGALAFALYRIRIGLARGFDEGYYLATPLRYALGDVPFRDEFFNPLRMFDLVLTPVFWLMPDIGLHTLRLGLVLFQLGALVVLIRLFSRFVPAGIAALAGASAVWIPNMIWAPGYHVMGSTFFMLGFSTWLIACVDGKSGKTLALAVASGIAIYLGALSYVPLLAVEIVPGLVWFRAVIGGRGRSAISVATAAHLATLLVLAIATVAGFALGGVLGDWQDAFATMNSLGEYALPLHLKIRAFGIQLVPYLVHAFAGVAFAVALVLGPERVRGARVWGVVAPAVLILGLMVLFFVLQVPLMRGQFGDAFTRPLRIVALLIGLQLGVSICAFVRRPEPAGDWAFVSRSLLAGTLILTLGFAFLSNMAFKAMFVAPTLAVCVVVALYRSVRGTVPAVSVTLALCLPIAAAAYVTRGLGDATEGMKAFSHPLLAGIRAPEKQVAALEELTTYLSTRVRPGDYLLAFDNLPLVYYLTQTRPAIDHAWPQWSIPGHVKERSLHRMQSAGRRSVYAVQRLGFQQNYPNALFDHVEKHYEREAEFPPYAVWKRR